MTRTSHFPQQRAMMARRQTRRQLVGAAAGVGAAWALGNQVSAQESTPPASPVAGEWSFTDDAGNTVTLPARPERIVADLNAASALWDFGIRVVAVSGYTVLTDAAWGNVDRSVPEINAGPETGAPDAEKLLALQPDLFVTITWSPDDPAAAYEWSFPDPAQEATARGIVPIVAISGTGLANQNTARFAELAGLLGADLATPDLIAAKEGYDAAVADFTDLVAEKSDLTSLFAYAGNDFEYVAYPPDWADLAMYQSLGLPIMEPDVAPGDYWEELSPELAMTYQSDVFFQSTRAEVLSHEELTAHPTYGQLPAVKAGQIGNWNQDFIMSYQGLTAALKTMLATLRTAEKVTE